MAGVLKRKVLERDDVGLCVMLPKTAWADAPPPGRTCTAVVNGAARQVSVLSEDCDCRGTGVHEHRYLVLPAESGLAPGDVCTIDLG